MNKTFLHFTAKVPFSLNINGNYIDIVDNIEKFSIDIIPNTNNLYVTFNPIGKDKTYLNFTQNIQIVDNQILCDCNFVKVIPFCDNHFEIEFEPILANTTKAFRVMYSKNFDNLSLEIINSENSEISLYQGEKLKLKTTCKTLKQVDSFVKESNLVLKGFIDKNYYFILIINLENYEIKLEKYCNKIEEFDEYLQVLSVANDISKHGIVYSYNYGKKCCENFTIYLNNEPLKTHIKALVPLQFLECIMVDNLKLANEFLTENLQNSNLDSIKDFFGNINNIYHNNYISNKINYTIENNGKYKNYTFEIADNKIVDIIEND